jgi:hypothetical protein
LVEVLLVAPLLVVVVIADFTGIETTADGVNPIGQFDENAFDLGLKNLGFTVNRLCEIQPTTCRPATTFLVRLTRLLTKNVKKPRTRLKCKSGIYPPGKGLAA